MTTADSRLEYLYRQYISKRCTKEELDELFAYVRDPSYRQVLEGMMDQWLETMDVPADLPVVDWEHLYRTVRPGEEPRRRAPLFTMARVAAAACILFVFVGGYLFFRMRAHRDLARHADQKDVAPGFNKAVLTLANGTTVVLDSAHTGNLGRQGDAVVVNAANGMLAYHATDGGDEGVSNTLRAPRGGFYKLALPDGTKVWLNAASSITFPSVFAGSDRTVEMTGEAYFEVMHDRKKPFRVRVGGQVIEDLGTHFNINAYADEPALVTTLLEGAVKVGGRILKPGEQASVMAAGNVTVEKGDPELAVAWKDGLFQFSNADLQAVLRQLARWYDVDVRYEGHIPDRQFNGMIGRTLTLDQVLKGLAGQDIHYRIEANNHLIITP